MYCSMRDAAESFIQRGGNLAFFSGNTVYWQVRYEDNWRTMVAFKNSSRDPNPDPTLKTDLFRALAPCRLDQRFARLDTSSDKFDKVAVTVCKMRGQTKLADHHYFLPQDIDRNKC